VPQKLSQTTENDGGKNFLRFVSYFAAGGIKVLAMIPAALPGVGMVSNQLYQLNISAYSLFIVPQSQAKYPVSSMNTGKA